MSIKNLSSLFEEKILQRKDRLSLSNKDRVIVGAGNPSSKSVIVSRTLKNLGAKKAFYVVNFRTEAFEMQKNLDIWTSFVSEAVDFENMEERDKVAKIYEMQSSQEDKIFVITADDFFMSFPRSQEIENQKLDLKKSQKVSIFEIFNWLIECGYSVAEENKLKIGEYLKQGSSLTVYPPNSKVIKLDFFGDKIESIFEYDQEAEKVVREIKTQELLPLKFKDSNGIWSNNLKSNSVLFLDEIENKTFSKDHSKISFLSFPEGEKEFERLRFLSCLKYYSLPEIITDFQDKIARDWKILCITKKATELKNILKEEKVPFYDVGKNIQEKRSIGVFNAKELDFIPTSFQNPEEKITVLSDRELFTFPLKEKAKLMPKKDVSVEFLSTLKAGDLVVHLNHGIGRFLGIEKKTIDNITREYLRIEYAEGDKLFVPVDQADKISKFVGDDDALPNLTRLGMTEWTAMQKRVKKEAKKIAKELLELFAKREMSKKGLKCKADTKEQLEFEKTFPYEETPGQARAILEAKTDMESAKPMDRLVCGDVGFGKTEVALRAAFKAVQNKKQVAFISPITILADQHYKTFMRRMKGFHVRVEMLSRFKTAAEQKKIIEKLAKGEIDVIIGTHSLLQPNIKFKNLGLLMIDEEQKFGVQQKETIKKLRANVDILTLTATPIPRTLNMALGKLRDITTITTPPPGRLPVITEVRRYSDLLIKEAINEELKRGGQIYFLHNRVQTIEAITDKLRKLVPNAKFIVAHGQMKSDELESKISAFKNGDYDVLVSSTIIENGIDLANANTLIVNDADQFGLSQLYQIRGRVGRGKTQAYAYFLYSSQKLKNDAKKRLRAIVEASDLGSGFQIAMKDLEIRGAGDILGISQHGAINAVGVGHFLRMLSQTVEEMKKGGVDIDTEEIDEDIVIDIPLPAFIPDSFISDTKEKISVYQKLAGIESEEELEETKKELIAEFGNAPEEMRNLFFVILLKVYARISGLKHIKIWSSKVDGKGEIVFWLSKKVTPAHIMSLLNFQPGWSVSGDKLIIRFRKLTLGWTEKLLASVKVLGRPLDGGKDTAGKKEREKVK